MDVRRGPPTTVRLIAAPTTRTAANRTFSSERPLWADSRRVPRSNPHPRCSAACCAISHSGFAGSSAAPPVTSAGTRPMSLTMVVVSVCWRRRVALALRVKGKTADPLRYLVYVSDLKLQMFLEQIDEPVRRSIAAQLKLDLKLVSLTLASSTVDRSLRQRSRIAKARRYRGLHPTSSSCRRPNFQARLPCGPC